MNEGGLQPNCLPLGHQILKEQEEWSQFVWHQFGPSAVLLFVSAMDNDRRTYRCGNRIAKVVRLWERGSQTRRWDGQSLENEYRVLSRLHDRGIRSSPVLENIPGWQVLTMDFLGEQNFLAAWQGRGVVGRLALLRAAVAALDRVHRAGVCHGDLTSENLAIDGDGRVRFFDWGAASFQAPVFARANEYKGFLFARHSLLQRITQRIVLRVVPGLSAIYRRVKLRTLLHFKMSISDAVAAAPFLPELLVLERGWARGARWNTSAGRLLAHPCLTVVGVHFSGARPWLLCWSLIAEMVDFRGKAVVDLGCNLGLLTTFSMCAGARSSTGVEAAAELVAAAQDVAAAFGVQATFLQRELGSTPRWEDELGGADLVVAMSIMERVSDRLRLLRFIGLHNEVLYEGHESQSVERERLRSIGFDHVEMVMMSDVGRALLYGRKTNVSTLSATASSADTRPGEDARKVTSWRRGPDEAE